MLVYERPKYPLTLLKERGVVMCTALQFLQSVPESSIRVAVYGSDRVNEAKTVRFLGAVSVQLCLEGEELVMIRGTIRLLTQSGRVVLDFGNSMNAQYPNSRIQGLESVGIDLASMYAIRKKIGDGGRFSKEISWKDGKLSIKDVSVSATLPELSEMGSRLASMAETISDGDKAAQKNKGKSQEEKALKELNK